LYNEAQQNQYQNKAKKTTQYITKHPSTQPFFNVKRQSARKQDIGTTRLCTFGGDGGWR
jgi:hypothetical protein